MMKKIKLAVLAILLLSGGCFANHIKGGFFTYRYLGPGTVDPAKLRYEVTLTVYMECNPGPSPGQLSNPINFSIFDAGSNTLLSQASVGITSQYVISKTTDEPCISGNQQVCYYTIVEYNLPSIELAPRPSGYTISYQRCCRIAGIVNIFNSSTIGNTYSISIPGSNIGQDAIRNSSPRFQINDTIVVCGGSYFEYSFLAADPDLNTLRYEFCDAWQGGGPGGGQAEPDPAAAPPYQTVPYSSGFSGPSPLGPNVTIDPITGLISGVAPSDPGEYVITVCVNEYKNNVFIATTRKELHIKIGNCSPIQAVLRPVYPTCDGFTRRFSNENPPNPDIQSYFWDFGDGNSSTEESPIHTYLDTGVYTIKLVVNPGGQCADSTTSLVKVFPGFFAGFTFAGICVNRPTQFIDTTNTIYGVVDTWSWNFGDITSLADTSHQQNPSYTFTQTGPKDVVFIVTNSKGCVDTIPQTIDILDKPPLSVGFIDTLICRGDTVQLQAIGEGNFAWTPNANIVDGNTAAPKVAPPATRTYTVELNQFGCINRDSVQVRVANFVTVEAGGPATICFTDSVQLSAISNGLQFEWTPVAEIDNPAIINPKARPSKVGLNIYQVTAYLGGCIPETSDFIVTTVPYPTAIAVANEDTICFEGSTTLQATTSSSSFTWSPTTGLINPLSLNPTAAPATTTQYVLTVIDPGSGCPKPSTDTATVTVLPKIYPFAGRDTVVVVGQPLQFQASGGLYYQWSPGTDLSNPAISNPVGRYRGDYDSIRYKALIFNQSGCFDSAFVTVKIFKTSPQVFVPTGFTPNRDGRNDVIRPIAVGITKIEYFRIFNRWGQMVFETSINGHGWDGKIKGKEQGTNVYVWIVKAFDYSGKEFFAKGTVTLIK